MYDLKILVPFSASASSEQAVRKAISMAEGKDAMISCLHVIEHPAFLSGLGNLKSAENAYKRSMEISISARLNSIFSAHTSIPFELIITGGKVFERIVEKAGQLDIDVIVMGRSDAETDSMTHFGSNTLKVIAASTIPVQSVGNTQYKLLNHA